MTLLAVVVLLAVGLWLLRPKRQVSAEPWEVRDAIEPVDRNALESAEREIQDLDMMQQPEDGFEADDWGPGTPG